VRPPVRVDGRSGAPTQMMLDGAVSVMGFWARAAHSRVASIHTTAQRSDCPASREGSSRSTSPDRAGS